MIPPISTKPHPQPITLKKARELAQLWIEYDALDNRLQNNGASTLLDHVLFEAKCRILREITAINEEFHNGLSK